jgi:AraC-like DNA-binding protein
MKRLQVHHTDPWPRPDNFRLLSVSTSIEAPGSTFGPWRMPHYGLAWIRQGSGTTRYDDRTIHTREGSVLLARPGVVAQHDWADVRCVQSFIVFDFDSVSPSWPAPEQWPTARQFAHDDPFIEILRCLMRFELVEETLPVVVPLAELLLRLFVSAVAWGAAEPAAPRLPDTVERAIHMIWRHVDQHPEELLRLPELARQVHVTPQHLCRLFKDALGLGPIECAQAMRLDLASSDLERTDLGLAQIAERFGFADQFHFSRAFKHNYGMSPSAYRKAFRHGGASRPAGLMFRHHPLRRYFYEPAPGRILEVDSSASPDAPSSGPLPSK